MAANNKLIVEVIGDTSKLTSSLNKAEADIQRFGRKSTIHTTGLDRTLADVRRMSDETAVLQRKAAQAEEESERLNTGMGRLAVGAIVAGAAVNVASHNLGELDGQVGRLGDSINDLTSLDFVGFFRDVRRETGPTIQALEQTGNATDLLALSNRLAGTSFDELAKKARAAALAITAAQPSFVDPTKIRDSTSPGAIAAEVSGLPLPDTKKTTRPGITAAQRNQFFDNDISRMLDRVQDLTLPQQVAQLKRIEALIEERRQKTKDITRRLTLEDEEVRVRRIRVAVETTIEQNAKDRAKATAEATKELAKQRAEREKLLEERRAEALQRKQFLALGFAADGSEVVGSTENLRKQFTSLINRLGASAAETGVDVTLNSKLKTKFEGVRKLLSGQFGTLTRESRQHIQEVFDAIRDEFDKQGSKGPLTTTKALDTSKILEGLGLSPASERELRARLAGFNTAGKALAGGIGANGIQLSVTLPDFYLDGKKVSTSVRSHNQIHAKQNPKQKRGS